MRYASAVQRTSAATIALLSATALTTPLHAQQRQPNTSHPVASTDTTHAPTHESRWSLRHLLPDAGLVGGLAISDSRLGLAKLEKSYGHWSLVSDITRDATRERWAANTNQVASNGRYVLWASSTSLRRYTRANGRGLFVEIGGGLGKAELEVSATGQSSTTRRANIPFASWGIGGRRGLGLGGLFVEGGLRSAIPLATRHVYTGATPPAGSTREPISYQSWYFGRGKATSQMYLGLGLRR